MADIEGDTRLQSDVLEDLSQAENYRRWLTELAVPFLVNGPVLEIGSGIGDYAADWASRGVSITASEADESRLAALRRRFADSRVNVAELTVPIVGDAAYSAVVAYNVLEHIPNDVEGLRGFRRLVAPGGRVVLVVPAFSFAMSSFDVAIGHQRRYTVGTLDSALRKAGFDVEHVRYVNPVGLIAWVLLVKWLRVRPQAGPLMTAWDRLFVPALRRLEDGRRPPFGQSVFAVARRT